MNERFDPLALLADLVACGEDGLSLGDVEGLALLYDRLSDAMCRDLKLALALTAPEPTRSGDALGRLTRAQRSTEVAELARGAA